MKLKSKLNRYPFILNYLHNFILFFHEQYQIQEILMKNSPQLEIVPIKNFVLDKYQIKPNNYTLSMKNQKVNNPKHFMVLRSASKSKKQPPKFSFQQQISTKININRQSIRPKTSLSRSYPKKLNQTQKNATIQKQCRDEDYKLNVNLNSYSSTKKIDFMTIIDNSNLKNCFPQRKTKKNRNQRWYQYCVSASIQKKFRNMYLTQDQIFQASLEPIPAQNPTKITNKLLYRAKSQKKQKKNQEKEKENVAQISPWNTNFVEYKN